MFIVTDLRENSRRANTETASLMLLKLSSNEVHQQNVLYSRLSSFIYVNSLATHSPSDLCYISDEGNDCLTFLSQNK